MHPMRDGEVDNWLVLTSAGLKASTAAFERGVPFEISPISLSNNSQLNFVGEIRIGVCDVKGEIKSWATESQRFEIPAMYGASSDAMTAVVNDEILEGDRIALFYRSDSSQKWFKVEPYTESACAEIVLKYAPIGKKTSMAFDRATGVLVVQYESDVKSALYLLSDFVETGVTITRGCMRVDTNKLKRDAIYTIYLERRGVESKSIMFTLKDL